MALEDRIRTSVDQAIQGLVSELVSTSESALAQELGAAEARLQGEFNNQIAQFEESQRQQTAEEVRLAVVAERARVEAEAQERFDAQLQAVVEAETARQVAEARRQFDEQVRQFDETLRVSIADAESRAIADTQSSVAAARVTERELEIAGMTRLVESIRGLDGAMSLSEVLDALALAAARETARAAVVVIKADRIVGWRLSGFGMRDSQPKSIDMSMAEAGVIGQAASSSRACTTRDGQNDGPGFEQIPSDRMGLAIPVVVGGRVVAVLYGDAVTDDVREHVVPSPWPEALEILSRHAAKCLEALTVQKSGSSTSIPVARKAGAAG
jgi:GAF domain